MPRNDQAAGASQPALEVHTCGPDVEITGIRDFDLDHIFDCGQCFRWNRGEDGSYTGTAYGRIVRMVWDPAKQMLRICGTTPEDFHDIWRGYLDLDRDYGQIKSYLAERDPVIRDAIGFGSGIRILNQEKWETVLSFLISQNNNIPRIRKCIDSLAETDGKKNRHIRWQRLLRTAFSRSSGRSCCGGSGTLPTRLPGEVSDPDGEAGRKRRHGRAGSPGGSRKSRQKRLVRAFADTAA